MMSICQLTMPNLPNIIPREEMDLSKKEGDDSKKSDLDDSGIQTIQHLDSDSLEGSFEKLNLGDSQAHEDANEEIKAVIITFDLESQETSRFAEDLGNHIELDMKVCKNIDDFTADSLPLDIYQTMYVIVDAAFCDIIFKKRKIHDEVDNFFEDVAERVRVVLVNRLADEDVRFTRLRTQLPERVCVHTDISVQTGDIKAQEQDNSEELHGGLDSLMVGYSNELTIDRTSHQNINVKTVGTNNTLNVFLVPAKTTSKVELTLTTNPKDQEQILKRELEHNKERVTIRIKEHKASIFSIRDGCIVIELDVEPGVVISPAWIESVLEKIFLDASIPKGTLLNVAAEVKNVLPVSKLSDFLSELHQEDDLHKNCVDKKEYEVVVTELEELKTRCLHATMSAKSSMDLMEEKSRFGLQMSVVMGDITMEKCDVIVNSTNPKLLLSDGTLSKAILRAAGQTIKNECMKKHGSGVKDGEVKVTGGGDMSCKEIYHITLPDTWLTDQIKTEKKLERILQKCLELADISSFRSICFPILGGGKLNYDPVRVAQIMSEVCQNFTPSYHLRDVKLVVLKDLPHIYDQIYQGINSMNKSYRRSESTPIISDKLQQPHTIRKMVSDPILGTGKDTHIEVIFKQHDIIRHKDLEFDIIVNSTSADLNLDSGALGQAIAKAAGPAVQAVCKRKYPKGLKEGETAITSGGNLCKHIIHTVLWKWNDSEKYELAQKFKDVIKDCLELATDNQAGIIAIPLLGTGRLQYPASYVAKWIQRAVHEYSTSAISTSIFRVYIIVNPLDKASITALIPEFFI